MTYDTPQALRVALEQRLRNRWEESGVPLDRLRRRVIFERVMARLQRAEPESWVLKGGMALEVRLGDDARLTKDIDLGLRENLVDADGLRERLIDALDQDLEEDGFVFAVGPVERMAEDGAGHLSWRAPVQVSLAGRPFGGIKIDISPRPHELEATDRLTIRSALDFAGAQPIEIDVVDVHRHAAEKFHAMLRDFGDKENSRVRDLVDVMLFLEHDLLDSRVLGAVVATVWNERDGSPPPRPFPPLPAGWSPRYERLAADHEVDPPSFDQAAARAAALWDEMFPSEET